MDWPGMQPEVLRKRRKIQ